MKTDVCRLSAIFLACLAFNASAATLYVSLQSTNPLPPYADWSAAATSIQDAVDAASPGDTVLVTNGVYQTGGRVVYGATTNRVALTKPLTVQSVNGPGATWIQGQQPVGTNGVRCAYLTNGAMLAGFTLCNGATRNAGDQLHEWHGGGVWCESRSAVLSNCVVAGNQAYANAGAVWSGTVKNSLIVSNVATGSGGGAYGSQLVDTVLVGNTVGRGYGGGAYAGVLTNCTITASVAGYGGGAANSLLYNCTIASNLVVMAGGGLYNCTSILSSISWNAAIPGYGGGSGGGLWGSTATNCLIVRNTAISGGGGYGGVWYSCTLTANVATNSGGAVYAGGGAWLYNCIAYGNSAPTGPDLYGAKFDFSCTTPPLVGGNDITNEPLFVDAASGDYHLQSNSPCINAGNNGYVSSGTDRDGNPRIQGGTVDIGAYEFQAPGSVLSYAWLQQYGLPTDGRMDLADTDKDGMNNWQEWVAGTDPTNASSVLQLFCPSNNGSGLVLTWPSVLGKLYVLERSTDLSGPFLTIRSNLYGRLGASSVTDTTATNSGPYFYRVGIWR